MLKSMMAALIFRAAELRSMEVLPIAFTMVSLLTPSCNLSFLRQRILSYFSSPHLLTSPPTESNAAAIMHRLRAHATSAVLRRRVHSTVEGLRLKLAAEKLVIHNFLPCQKGCFNEFEDSENWCLLQEIFIQVYVRRICIAFVNYICSRYIMYKQTRRYKSLSFAR